MDVLHWFLEGAVQSHVDEMDVGHPTANIEWNACLVDVNQRFRAVPVCLNSIKMMPWAWGFCWGWHSPHTIVTKYQ